MRVLFVDDDIHAQIAVAEHLRVLSKFEVVSAYDGVQALAILDKDQRFDAIVLDSRMPNMDGHDFLERYTGSVPVIWSSGYTHEAPRKPVAATHPKPTDAFELAAIVRRLATTPP